MNPFEALWNGLVRLFRIDKLNEWIYRKLEGHK
jgi:hypothetical protein